MKARFGVRRGTALVAALLVAVIALFLPGPAAARTDDNGAHSDHWGVIARNTIGSPVAELRNGPYGPFGTTGAAARPPYGRGSLGIEVADRSTSLTPPSEKVDFGNEVDFFGKQVLGLRRVGFHVFQTGENVGYGGPTNMPNIRFEIDPNVTSGDDYATLVWVPNASPVTNGWSPFLDATRTGYWYLTDGETRCDRAARCTFSQLKTSFTSVNAKPTVYTVAVGKGPDFLWIGAIDGLRLNDYVYDFERDGVKVLRAK
ncbi:hypothetical protein J2X68_008001 [Streptomyces sp. 3330]|uniref:hypothetical protein n=1 Tax=Streptomyces sp. 3330 TaxID=2817755 RepID=UPI00285CC319|nr:hypothetical protein [Streptomyces sp. 3330]MDR6981259.1 hypothetical protein [Streptomyces sp. 3330]